MKYGDFCVAIQGKYEIWQYVTESQSFVDTVPDEWLMKRDEGRVNSNRHDRKMEVVKHDINVLVDASLKAKVQTKCAAADIL